MNLSRGQAASQQRGDIKTSGAGGTLGGAANAGPAHPLTVGAVGFASNWPHELADEVMDQMAESIVDLARKLEESEARVAVLEEERRIIVRERDEAQNVVEDWLRWAKEVLTDFRIPFDEHTIGIRSAFTVWMADMRRERDELRADQINHENLSMRYMDERDEARDTVLRLRRQRVSQDAMIESLRDEACRESCRDKAAADGGWANI